MAENIVEASNVYIRGITRLIFIINKVVSNIDIYYIMIKVFNDKQ